jgi:flagellar assembly factor FliW
MKPAGLVTIDHHRVGPIDIGEASILQFDGLPGFPSARSFALVERDETPPFAWLASLDDLDLAFTVLDPSELLTSYAPRPSANDLRAVDAKDSNEVAWLVLVNVQADGVYVNLAAPILVNAAKQRAAQIVLADASLPLRSPLRIEPPPPA